MRLIDAEAFDVRVRLAGGMSEEELTDDFKDGVLAVLELLKTQPTIKPHISDYAKLGMEVSTFNNCNNCKDKKCKYKPKLGDMVRWNCPLWKGTEDA